MGQSTLLVPDPKLKMVFRAANSAAESLGNIHKDAVSSSQTSFSFILPQGEVVPGGDYRSLFPDSYKERSGAHPQWAVVLRLSPGRELGGASCWAGTWSCGQMCGLGTETRCLFRGAACAEAPAWSFHCEMIFSKFSLKP